MYGVKYNIIKLFIYKIKNMNNVRLLYNIKPWCLIMTYSDYIYDYMSKLTNSVNYEIYLINGLIYSVLLPV